jgi:uncharacterized membrane protein
MFWSIIKIILVVALPFGIGAGLFGIWFDSYLEKKHPSMSPEKRSKFGTVVMLGVATVLLVGFFIIMHIMT